MQYIIIGLVCNSISCYWVQVDEKTVFSDLKNCQEKTALWKENTAMYFKMECMVK